MGGAGLKELLKRRDRFDIVTLARPSKKNKEKMQEYQHEAGLKIIWGDLTNYDDVLRGVNGADIVLHPAAFIAPGADHDPIAAQKINVGSAENIVRAIKSQPEPDKIKLVNIGSVAMTGDRLYPIHVGRTGDPLKPSIYDAYACSKIDAERVVAESGLQYWVSCRQTFVAIPDTLALMDPIMYHQPLETCIEFCTVHDAGLLLANVCEDSVPETFWRKFYNIGGGAKSRITYLELMERVYAAIGMGSPDQLMERNWFALRNFHCQWFEDSDKLNHVLDFRTMGMDEYVDSVIAGSPWYMTLPNVPVIHKIMELDPVKEIIHNHVMKPLATEKNDSTQYWLKHNLQDRISAFFKDKKSWQNIDSSWEGISRPSFDDYQRLQHGYDESQPDDALDLAQMKNAAKFRGGLCYSDEMKAGDLLATLTWQCWRGHEFELTPNAVLKGGHWCPECQPTRLGWDYDEEAKHNPFFAQVWYNNHDKDEVNYYAPDCYLDIVGADE